MTALHYGHSIVQKNYGAHRNFILCVSVCVEIVIGLEMTSYTVDEMTGVATVCAVLLSGTITKDIDVTFTAGNPGTATGKKIRIAITVNHMYAISFTCLQATVIMLLAL